MLPALRPAAGTDKRVGTQVQEGTKNFEGPNIVKGEISSRLSQSGQVHSSPVSSLVYGRS